MNHKYDLSPTQLRDAIILYHNDEPIKKIAEGIGCSESFITRQISNNYEKFIMERNFHLSDLPKAQKIKVVGEHKKNMERFLNTKLSERDQEKIMNEIMCCEDFITNNYGE